MSSPNAPINTTSDRTISTPGLPQFAPAALINEASDLTQRFVGTLLPTLQSAMQEGGPLNAIDVCALEAPRIAQQLSEESGWDVTRVSLKARNSRSAVPDSWETQVLHMFDQRQQAGESAATLNVAETVNGNFRYMQAQPTAPLCLTCHGSEVSQEVLSAIRAKYPNDLAIGYQAGQIRGAISLRKPM
tara:strand:- start:325 stop:888 length:564 start_codon:yes stop_codon:yes gene_type:complete